MCSRKVELTGVCVQDPEIQKATGETDPVSVMSKLREMKNNFK
jgi:hydroxyacylglutathione hydrolase